MGSFRKCWHTTPCRCHKPKWLRDATWPLDVVVDGVTGKERSPTQHEAAGRWIPIVAEAYLSGASQSHLKRDCEGPVWSLESPTGSEAELSSQTLTLSQRSTSDGGTATEHKTPLKWLGRCQWRCSVVHCFGTRLCDCGGSRGGSVLDWQRSRVVCAHTMAGNGCDRLTVALMDQFMQQVGLIACPSVGSVCEGSDR